MPLPRRQFLHLAILGAPAGTSVEITEQINRELTPDGAALHPATFASPPLEYRIPRWRVVHRGPKIVCWRICFPATIGTAASMQPYL